MNVEKKLNILKLLNIFFFLLLILGNIALAGGEGIWKGTQCAESSKYGGPTIPCDFCDAIIVANNILNMIATWIMVVGGLMIAVGGVLFIISMGPSGSRDLFTKAKKSIFRAITGVVIALISYLIIGTFLHIITGNLNFPWDKISCEHNTAYKNIDIDWLTSQYTYPEEWKNYYVKLASDGIFACNTDASYLTNNVNPTGTDPVRLLHLLSKLGSYGGNVQSSNLKDMSQICGKNAIDVTKDLGVKKQAVFARKNERGEYECRYSGNCYGLGASTKPCELLIGDPSYISSTCKAFK